jgi:hypothetical protein
MRVVVAASGGIPNAALSTSVFSAQTTGFLLSYAKQILKELTSAPISPLRSFFAPSPFPKYLASACSLRTKN